MAKLRAFEIEAIVHTIVQKIENKLRDNNPVSNSDKAYIKTHNAKVDELEKTISLANEKLKDLETLAEKRFKNQKKFGDNTIINVTYKGRISIDTDRIWIDYKKRNEIQTKITLASIGSGEEMNALIDKLTNEYVS